MSDLPKMDPDDGIADGVGDLLLPILDISNKRGEEGVDAILRLRVTLSEPASEEVSVTHQTRDSTAKAGQDYQSVTGTLVIAAGATHGFIEVPLLDDTRAELEERFIVDLLSAEGADIGDAVGLGWIEDDDPTTPIPDLEIGNRRLEEAPDAEATLRLSLSEPSDQDITVTYATRNSTAKAGEDFVETQGQIVIPAGETRVFIDIDLINDNQAEAEERFFVDILSAEGATVTDAVGRVRIEDSDDPGQPTVTIADVTVIEGDPGSTGGGTGQIAPGPLSTSGNQIIDSSGTQVEIRAVNWFGLETNLQAPHGLWARNWQDMMDQMKGLGFNAIRLPFSSELVLDGATPSGINFGLNPDLQGLSGLEIMDKIVDYADEIGMRILLDHHRSEAGDGANSGGLWYQGAYSEDDWIEVWETLAQRYLGQDAVIGADIHNEPHGPATWGDGSANDWAAAAERAGNAIHAINADWLIVVEGIGAYQGNNYWWGGNLQGVADRPVELDQSGKLVYSPHDYPASVFPQPWFFDGSDLYQVFDEHWGYIYREEIAPVLLGEFGSRLQTQVDRDWAEAIVTYLDGDFDGDGSRDIPADQAGISWAWWSWNPNSGDTGGILEDDWTTVRLGAIGVLQPLLEEPSGGEPQPGDGSPQILFQVDLAQAAEEELVFQVRTLDGTARAGDDYEALNETLIFEVGESSKTVAVTLLPDLLAEADETFSLELSGAGLDPVVAQATILDDDAT
ncbi:MAG: cellulase family glycosylhydrolase, partial [Pseudomonadota bacterium]